MQTDTKPQKEMLDVDTFLDVYSISRNKFYKEVKRKALRITKIGSRSYVTKQDAATWIERIRAETGE